MSTKVEQVAEQTAPEFEEVLKELDAFAKAMGEPCPPKKAKKPTMEAPPEVEGEDEGEEEDGMPPMKKAVVSEEDDAAPAGEAYDGEQVIAGFNATLKKSIGQVEGLLRQQAAVMAKSLSAMGQRIVSLEAELAALGKQPTLRKSVLTIHERGSAAGAGAEVAAGDPCSRDEFMAKAVNSGLGGARVSEINQYLRLNPDKPIQEAVPPHLYAAVMTPKQ